MGAGDPRVGRPGLAADAEAIETVAPAWRTIVDAADRHHSVDGRRAEAQADADD